MHNIPIARNMSSANEQSDWDLDSPSCCCQVDSRNGALCDGPLRDDEREGPPVEHHVGAVAENKAGKNCILHRAVRVGRRAKELSRRRQGCARTVLVRRAHCQQEGGSCKVQREGRSPGAALQHQVGARIACRRSQLVRPSR